MTDARRAAILPVDEEQIAPEAEALARAYLNAAEGNPSHALRLAAADRVSDLERLHARVCQLQALVSRRLSSDSRLVTKTKTRRGEPAG
jgi:hypothetical protein